MSVIDLHTTPRGMGQEYFGPHPEKKAVNRTNSTTTFFTLNLLS